MIFLGVDPGLSGVLSVLDQDDCGIHPTAMGQTMNGQGDRMTRNASMVLIIIMFLLSGCGSSIRSLGVLPQTAGEPYRIECYAMKDRDFFVAGILLLCTQEGQIQAVSGGAAPGAAGFLGSVVQGAGTLGAGLAISSGIGSLGSINVKGQIVPNAVNVGGNVGVTGTLKMVPVHP